MRWLRWASLALAVLAVGTLAFLAQRLLYTQQGLEFALSQLQRVKTARIEVRGARGAIAGNAVLRSGGRGPCGRACRGRRRQRHAARSRPAGREAHGADASIGRVEVIIKDRGPQPETQTHFLPAWLSIVGAGCRRAPDGRHAQDRPAHARRERARRSAHDALAHRRGSHSSSRIPPDAVTGNVFLRATLPLGLRGEVSGAGGCPTNATYRFSARVKGKLDRLGIDASLTEPARLAFSGTGLDLNHEARAVGTLRAIEFDGSPWIPPGRLPLVSGSLSVDARLDAIGVSGTLTSPMFGPEQLRVRGSGKYADDGARRRVTEGMDAALGPDGLDGRRRSVSRRTPRFWTSRATGPGSAGRLRATRSSRAPSGRYSLAGALPYAFELHGPGGRDRRFLPPASPPPDRSTAGSCWSGGSTERLSTAG